MKHEDGSTSSSVNCTQQSPDLEYQSPVNATLRPPPGPSDFLIPSPTRPIRRPVGHASESSASRQGFSMQNSTSTTPFSTSSPGTFGVHMEHRGRGAQVPRNRQQDSRTSRDREEDPVEREKINAAKSIFKPLEEYIVASFGSYECINSSFSTMRPNLAPRAASEGSSKLMAPAPTPNRQARADAQLSELDAKTLLIGDFAENGYWWTGERSEASPERTRTHRGEATRDATDAVTLKSPRIDWPELTEWYHIVTNAGRSWRKKLDDFALMEFHDPRNRLTDQELEYIDEQFKDAQFRMQRVLLKATESLLKRPSRPLNEPRDLRFLLIMLGNPLLYSSSQTTNNPRDRSRSRSKSRENRSHVRSASGEALKHSKTPSTPSLPHPSTFNKGSSQHHSGIIKRILGLLSNVPNECHHHLVSWLARYSDSQFQKITDLIGSFVTYRLTRQQGKKREVDIDHTAGLVPNMRRGHAENSQAALHAVLGHGMASQTVVQQQLAKNAPAKPKPVIYNDDWQIKAAARVMALVFAANNSGLIRRGDRSLVSVSETARSVGLAARERAQVHGQILATSDFYNTLLDYSDLVADFEAWESKRGKFAFCQYPFFLSIWAKIQIMEHDARRQMEVKAREAFFDSIMTRKNVNQYLNLKIRRECLVEDSLKSVSEIVGTGGEEIKKGLRIEFKGEEGIDAGGLRKEWFLLLVREVFNPEHGWYFLPLVLCLSNIPTGMFIYDDDSQFCYFNPNSFETTDQFFLVGVVLGLAIYNSTILDVAFPPFAFRKLLAAAPAAAPGSTSHVKPTMTYSLEDLAEFRPSLAHGLRQLLEFDGDVENVFCRDFVADVERYGEIMQIPLCPNGEKKAVTNANRREFVDLYVRYLLDVAVIRQFEPFKRGFFTVCGGNALSLFRAEEIELLIRGSEEPLDIASLRAVSKNENWGKPNATEVEPVIQWFWQSFQAADHKDQRKLLSFITGSDRIPAMGATNLVIRLACLGDDSPRYPVARTCFNQISLWRYSSKLKLEKLLWGAVYESEGFGLK